MAAAADEPFEASVGRELSVLANIPATIVFLRSEVARQRGDPERAAELIRLGLSRLTDADQALRALAPWGLAMAAMMQGRLQEAERALAEVVTDPHLTSVRPWYDLGPHPADRVLAAGGEADKALGLLERVHALAAAQGRVTSMIDARALQAMALEAVDDQDGALVVLTEALALAQPGRYLQGFVDQGRPMAVLVGKLATMPAAGRAAAAQVPRPFLERLVEPLTAWELELLP